MASVAEGERRNYRSSRREAQARRTRQRVLGAATEVFLDRGYAAATMRSIAAKAGVSVATVELLFGTKAALLKAAIDVAIAGDDEPVPILDRDWTATANDAQTVDGYLAVVAGAVGPAQVRSAGLVLAVFEGSTIDAGLADLAARMIAQRRTTATWIVDGLIRRAPLRTSGTRQEAIDTVWILMDPAVFDRLTRHRRWSVARYQRWLARSIGLLLMDDAASPPPPTLTRRSR